MSAPTPALPPSAVLCGVVWAEPIPDALCPWCLSPSLRSRCDWRPASDTDPTPVLIRLHECVSVDADGRPDCGWTRLP